MNIDDALLELQRLRELYGNLRIVVVSGHRCVKCGDAEYDDATIDIGKDGDVRVAVIE